MNQVISTPPAAAVADAVVAGPPLPADRHPALVYLARLAPGSRRTMRTSLNAIAKLLTAGRCDMESLDWSSLRYQHSAAVRAALAEQFAPATANKMLAALRGVLQEAWRLGLMSADAYQRAVDLPSIRGSTLPRGRALKIRELRALFEVCAEDATISGRRDAALLALLYGAGLRRSEVVALDLIDYDRAGMTVTVRRGKGAKSRTCFVGGGLRQALDAWLDARGDVPGPLLLPVGKGGRLRHQRLSGQAVLHIVVHRAAQAGIPRVSPHDFRRSFVTHLLDAGVDIATVQRLVAHSNLQTTARYDRRGEEAMRNATRLLEIPVGPGKSGS